MIDYLRRFIVPAAYSVLPPAMASEKATAMLLAIALQESGAHHRRQVHGPARGFWQFEPIGVRGVFEHPATATLARTVLERLCYPRALTVPAVAEIIEDNDVLACALARLTLWPLRAVLPNRTQFEPAWEQYLRAWRPGKPRRATWDADFAYAWNLLEQKED